MRTVAVRFSTAEHRVVHDLAAAQEMSVETLLRDALGLAPIDATRQSARRLEVVRGSAPESVGEKGRSDAVPIS